MPRAPEQVSAQFLIDISAVVNQGAGIGRYGRELTRELIPLLQPDNVDLWYAADTHPAALDTLDRNPWNQCRVTRARISRLNTDRVLMRAHLPISRLLGIGNVPDSYSPDFTALPGKREHLTVHDLAWRHPEAQSPPPLAAYLGPVVDRAIQRATTIFTVSAAIRTEILERYRVRDERVIVAPNAATEHFFAASPLAESDLSSLGVRVPYLLHVGTIEPRKNLPVLLEAVAQLPAEWSLVIAGRDGWNADVEFASIDRLGIRSRVLRLGYVPEDVLAGLVASASVLVAPSRYEGFGLPLVEGLATGVPVAASDLPVFREVGGDAVQYFDPTDSDALSVAIERCCSPSQTSVAARSRRVLQARKFNWATSANIVAQRLMEFT